MTPSWWHLADDTKLQVISTAALFDIAWYYSQTQFID